MSDIHDFNDTSHRVESASAAFQKGIYHLFFIANRESEDVFANVLRFYQSVFQLCAAQALLDEEFRIANKSLLRRLGRSCADPGSPTRKEIDPAALITHADFQYSKWKGFNSPRRLRLVSNESLGLYRRVVQSRHNLLYRPFMLDQLYWENCSVRDLLVELPRPDEVENVYRECVGAIVNWECDTESSQASRTQPLERPRAFSYFLELLFMPFKDQRNEYKTETLLLAYARMLNPNGGELFEDIKRFRNHLLDVPRIAGSVRLLPEWQAGER